jgi:pilus assembly protein Flp/PilA
MQKFEMPNVELERVDQRRRLTGAIRRFMRDESGATSIEYAMIASGIAVVIAATIVSLGSSVKGMYSNVLTAMK